MTLSTLPPSADTEVAALKVRVTNLERKLGAFLLENPPQDICTFPGILFAQRSPDFSPPVGRTYERLYITIVDPPTAPMTFRLLLEGVTFSNHTIPSGTTEIGFAIHFPVGPGEVVRCQIVVGNNNAVDLVAHLRYTHRINANR